MGLHKNTHKKGEIKPCFIDLDKIPRYIFELKKQVTTTMHNKNQVTYTRMCVSVPQRSRERARPLLVSEVLTVWLPRAEPPAPGPRLAIRSAPLRQAFQRLEVALVTGMTPGKVPGIGGRTVEEQFYFPSTISLFCEDQIKWNKTTVISPRARESDRAGVDRLLATMHSPFHSLSTCLSRIGLPAHCSWAPCLRKVPPWGPSLGCYSKGLGGGPFLKAASSAGSTVQALFS